MFFFGFFFSFTDEADYWWFELAILLNKTMMCGGLVVLNPGSPTQVVCGTMIMMFHLLLVLKLAPYINASEDWSIFSSSLGLTLTYVGALLKMLQDQRRKEFDPNELKYADVAMNVLPIACVTIVVLIMVFVDCGVWNCIKGRKDSSEKIQKNSKSNKALTQVQPIQSDDNENEKKTNDTNNTKTDQKKKQQTAIEVEENLAVKNWEST